MNFEHLIKQYIQNGEFDNCVSLLTKQIKHALIQKLNQFIPNYKYSTLTNLIDDCIPYFSANLYALTKKFYSICYEEYKPEFETELLLEIYHQILKEK